MRFGFRTYFKQNQPNEWFEMIKKTLVEGGKDGISKGHFNY